jgi:hypothetical protein
VCDLETSRIGAPYIYDISNLRVNEVQNVWSYISTLHITFGNVHKEIFTMFLVKGDS